MDNDLTKGAFKQLEEEQVIKIIAWFRTKDEFKKSKSDIYPKQYFWQDVIEKEFIRNDFAYCPEDIYNKIYEKTYLLMDLFARSVELEGCNIHDFLNIINMYANSFYSFLKREKVDVIFFGSVPHEGPNYLVYIIAKILDIKTIIMLQSIFPNKFHYCYDINDFGEFNNVSNYQKVYEKCEISNEYEKNLFYMEKNYEKEKKVGLKKDKINWIDKRYKRLKINIVKYSGLKDYIYKKLYKKFIKYADNNTYKINCKKNSTNSLNLDEKFVYFPLHLQPEMTTSIMGGHYCDQLLAIERLAQKIPSGWKIYIKENPKQTSYMRGKYFFDRLKLIKNAVLVDSSYNTYDLISKSKFVATITGTAGWEAISGGKNVLIFGLAWYKKLPGVFQYNDKIDVSNIFNNKINHEQLENELEKLMKKMGDGVIDQEYIKIKTNFNLEENKITLNSFFKFALEDNRV